MFGALADAGVNIEMISTSEIRITCIIAEDQVDEAARALHRAFRLEQPDGSETTASRRQLTAASYADVPRLARRRDPRIGAVRGRRESSARWMRPGVLRADRGRPARMDASTRH